MSGPKRSNFVDAPGSSPEVCLLSNGRYSVMLTSSGGGYSTLDGMDVTRWREDSTRDCWGQYCYVRNLDDGRAWSAGHQPLGRNADEYEADLGPDRAIIRRRDSDVETYYEVAVVSDADAEVRRVTLANRGDRPRTLEVTSYAEVALNPRRADQAHPAFAKLFLETEYHASPPALLCRRRPRAQDQQPVWALHVLASEVPGEVEYETDRARFLGRGRSTRNPAVMDSDVALSRTVGPVLDPVFSLRQRIRVQPGASAILAFTTAAPANRDQALALAARFGSLETVDRVFEETIVSNAARQAQLGLMPDDAALFQRLAAPVLFASPSLRSRESVARNRLGQPGLWPHGISGDVPIALVRIGADRNLELVQQVLGAHAYWRRWGLVADLVLLQDDATRRTAPPAGGPGAEGAHGRTGRPAGRRVPPRRVPHVGGLRDTARGGCPSHPPRG
jgi:cellobiose phosphorylase